MEFDDVKALARRGGKPKLVAAILRQHRRKVTTRPIRLWWSRSKGIILGWSGSILYVVSLWLLFFQWNRIGLYLIIGEALIVVGRELLYS